MSNIKANVIVYICKYKIKRFVSKYQIYIYIYIYNNDISYNTTTYIKLSLLCK